MRWRKRKENVEYYLYGRRGAEEVFARKPRRIRERLLIVMQTNYSK